MTVPLQFIYFCIFSHVYFYGVLTPLNKISVILVEETGVSGENHRFFTGH
jgi:hypothetical protein